MIQPKPGGIRPGGILPKIHIVGGIVGCYRDTHCDFQKCCYSRDEKCKCDRRECGNA